MYSDDPLKLKSQFDIIQDLEKHTFYVQKSNLSIYRFEDVIFSVFPHLASHKRKTSSTKEIFIKVDPFNRGHGSMS